MQQLSFDEKLSPFCSFYFKRVFQTLFVYWPYFYSSQAEIQQLVPYRTVISKAFCISFALYLMERNKDKCYTAFTLLLFLIESTPSDVRELLHFNIHAPRELSGYLRLIEQKKLLHFTIMQTIICLKYLKQSSLL